MDTAVLLNRLKNHAEALQLPLNQVYMNSLRQALCRYRQIDEAAYGHWIAGMLQDAGIRHDEGWSGHRDAVEMADVPALLLLGDACAADRADTGSFYTPRSIARFMSAEALKQTLKYRFPHCGELADRCFTGEPLAADEALTLQELMRKLRILDMACGNGIFLEACLDWYCRLARFSGSDTSGSLFVSESLCGTDIRPDALESWAVSLGCRAPEFMEGFSGLKAACISSVQGDAVLEIPWVSEIMASGGFDLVVGNPPYVGEKGNRELFEKLRDSDFGQRHYEGRMDLFYYFLHRGIDLLRAGGILSQITTSYYATADFAAKLRHRLRSNGGISGLVSFNDQRVFAGAMGHHLILFYQKGIPEGTAELITYTGARRLATYDFEDLSFAAEGSHYKRYTVADRRTLFDERGHMILDPSRWETDQLDALNRACPEKLKALVRINQGIVSGADRSDAGGIFVLEAGEVFDEAAPWLVPWYKNGDIRRYRASARTDKSLIYIRNEAEATVPPAVLAHFSPHRDKLSRRRECQSGARPWYGLQWPRDREIFEGPKLVAPQRCAENRFAYTEGPWFASADVYFLTRPAPGVSLWALLAYLNSDLMFHWFLHCGKRKGRHLELYATPLGNVPVNREWLIPGGVLHEWGIALYEASGTDESRIAPLRLKVEAWLEEQLESIRVFQT